MDWPRDNACITGFNFFELPSVVGVKCGSCQSRVRGEATSQVRGHVIVKCGVMSTSSGAMADAHKPGTSKIYTSFFLKNTLIPTSRIYPELNI